MKQYQENPYIEKHAVSVMLWLQRGYIIIFSRKIIWYVRGWKGRGEYKRQYIASVFVPQKYCDTDAPDDAALSSRKCE